MNLHRYIIKPFYKKATQSAVDEIAMKNAEEATNYISETFKRADEYNLRKAFGEVTKKNPGDDIAASLNQLSDDDLGKVMDKYNELIQDDWTSEANEINKETLFANRKPG